MKSLLTMAVAIMLCACAPAQDTGVQLANDLHDSGYETADKLQEWMFTHPTKAPPQPVSSAYCYHAYQDILCYRRPMPGWENRLVAYQGTDAEPPPPAVMQPLPVPAAEGNRTPALRAASAKPVFVSPPPPVKDSDKQADMAVPLTDASQLPDPALSPQL